MAVAPAILQPTLFFFFLFLLFITFPLIYSMSEAEALLSLKNSFSNAEALNSWVAFSVPCSSWEGVVCYNGFVTGLRLGGMGLSGIINVDALLELKGLRTISIVNNSFSGSIPELNRIGFLKAMYFSGNKFSGDIPQDYFQRMRSLKKLWLSDNEFTGNIPSSLGEIPHLIELHLENNQFSGSIPNLENPSLVEINVSNNKLEGEVPPSLLKFHESSFSGNSGLCGDKFGKTCEKATEDTNPVNAQNNAEHNNNIGNVSGGTNGSKGRNSTLQIVGIIAASVVLISLIVFFIVRSRRKKDKNFDMIGQQINDGSVEVQVTAPVKREVDSMKKTSSRRGSSHGKGTGELVIVNDEKGIFGLPDLMKAAAEVLGNGGFGSSYKAVMVNGVAVVVKRSREMNALEKDGFDAEMRKLGNLKHWNILTPLAYHFRKDEKLVISEYVPRGSLLFFLHGDRGSHAELDWPARLKIVRGIAEGMTYLHTELASSNLPHGNLKSSNVLLGPDYEPMLVDYGFIHLVNPSSARQALFAYKAPEAAQQGQVSPICDVYCLGVVILEILTGKFPSQYLSNGKGGTDVVEWVKSAITEGRESELLDPAITSSRNSLGEMARLLHIGAACTESNPQQRLDMVEAIRRIEEIKTEGSRESRTIEVLPSLRDGYADSHVFDTQGQGHVEQSRRRHGSDSGSQEYFEFGIS
ncbi:pollen receptor-like kinase 3 [Gastrolobium bilobum]|uniref:pollen receptor-like kinase 3 n=1 Tax=Gastrolobium bilobum TaxID=150636 RepID=UPI002AB1C90D|nr:pollen receptor-like kinase 3 [Gastrolobium bilobum]